MTAFSMDGMIHFPLRDGISMDVSWRRARGIVFFRDVPEYEIQLVCTAIYSGLDCHHRLAI